MIACSKLLSSVFVSTICLANDRLPAKLTFHVVNDSGIPIPGVKLAASTFVRWEAGESFGKDIHEQFAAMTDERGFASVSAVSLRGEFAYSANPGAGYYRGGAGRFKFDGEKNGRWEPWNPVIEIELKPILNPIPLYARKVGGIANPVEIPATGNLAGFDLIAGDWVSPNGVGRIPDLVFTLRELVPFTGVENPFDYALVVTFSKLGDGIQSVRTPPHKESELRLPRHAPESGYEPLLEKRAGRPGVGMPIQTGFKEDQNYFFRVRTVFDDNGQIKSAHYGKINGDIQFWRNRRLRFAYYLNPTPLDRNLEFDPQRNLFTKLGGLEGVTEP